MEYRKRFAQAALVAAILIALSTPAFALTLGFEEILPTDESLVQVSVDITSGGGNVYFSFTNDSLDATVSQIYFEDTLGLLSGGVVEYGMSLGTLEFAIGTVNPGVLPNSNSLAQPFIVTTDISAGSVGANANSIDGGEILVLSYQGDYDALAAAILDGSFRIGLHVTSIQTGGSGFIGIISDTPVDPVPDPPGTVVPEPATMSILALGIAGMAVRMRRKATANARA